MPFEPGKSPLAQNWFVSICEPPPAGVRKEQCHQSRGKSVGMSSGTAAEAGPFSQSGKPRSPTLCCAHNTRALGSSETHHPSIPQGDEIMQCSVAVRIMGNECKTMTISWWASTQQISLNGDFNIIACTRLTHPGCAKMALMNGYF